MIPPVMHPDTPSSERRIFQLLEQDPQTITWTVLHSLGLSRRGAKPYGEIDFLMMVPGEGVLCLEVKGGRVGCRNGVWYTRDRHGIEHALARSPFQQARDGMFGLREAVCSKFNSAHAAPRLLYASAVTFPDVAAPPLSPGFERWEVIDADDLTHGISEAVVRAFRGTSLRLAGSDRRQLATTSVLNELRAFLRPDFDVGLARRATIARSEERVLRLTEEQYDVLDLFERNHRCLIEGAAGTGKTALGMEFARRMSQRGMKILFICYNRLLGEWLEREAAAFPGADIRAGSFHRIIRDIILSSSHATEFLAAERSGRNSDRLSDLFSVVYPLYGLLAVSETENRPDLLIVDEAQDLLARDVLDVLNAWLIHGIDGGRWVMLGDFTRQAIFGSGTSEPAVAAQFETYNAHFTTATLRRNCRNTRRIGEETALLSGFESLPYRLDSSNCLPVDYRYWKDVAHERHRLTDVLDSLLRDGIQPEDILILSHRKFEQSAARDLPGHNVIPVDTLQHGSSSIRFCTIQAFKGLESPVVIVCDIDSLENEHDRALIYVAMSRARSHLILLMKHGLEKAVADAVQKKIEKDWGNGV